LSGALTLVLNGISYLGIFRYGFHKVRAGIMVVYIFAMLSPQIVIFVQQVSETEFFLIRIAEMPWTTLLGLVAAGVAVFCGCFVFSIKAKAGRVP
jgi:hypothetical protein